MGKVRIAVMGYGMMARMFRNLVLPGEFRDIVDLSVYDLFWDEALQTAKRLESEKAVDVFISGGANAAYIRPHLETPVVFIDITTADLASAIRKAAGYGGPVAVTSYAEPLTGLEVLKDILKPNVVPVIYEAYQELWNKLKAFKEQGGRAVVGASLACELATQLGLETVLIYSEDSLHLAVRHAVEIAQSRLREVQRTESLRKVIEFTYTGILVTDERGIVTVFNPAAERILGMPARQVIGREAEQIFAPLRVKEALAGGKSEVGCIQEVRGVKIVSNTVPITGKGDRILGVVVTFQDSASIKRVSDEMRSAQYKKGFIAKSKLSDIKYGSRSMRDLVEVAKRYSKTDLPVLILGESGTGKELFAQGIHNESLRSNGPFVAVNCAALSESLLESELFGYEEGSFTGARRGGKEGLCELANRGTLFLDEIAEISPQVQAHLLRVLQEREVLRVGGTRVIPVNIRIIASTNKDLWSLVQAGLFRDDLYYRLNVLCIRIPPLRDRPEDIPVLVREFVGRHPAANKTLLEEDRLGAICKPLLSYTWPGNVRQLENLLERLIVVLEGEAPSPSNLRALVEGLLKEACEEWGTAPSSPEEPDAVFERTMSERLREAKIAAAREALSRFSGNKSQAARSLGISRSTLWRMLRDERSSRCSGRGPVQ